MTEPAADPVTPVRTRDDRVAAATRRWIDSLVDLGGRNTLLFYRDLRVGTLDLANAEPEPRKALLDGQPTALTRLFPHDPLRTAALRSARTIRNKAREVAEERGIHVGHVAVGMATWRDSHGRTPAAPVLLRRVDIEARSAAEQDFTLHVADDVEVNPVLLHYLATELGVRIAADDLLDPYGELVYTHVVDRLRESAPAHVVDGFAISHRAVVGTFSYAKLPMVQDLEQAGELLGTHDVVAAMAGDPGALRAVRGTEPPADAPDRPASEEFLVLDADGSQEAVVDAVMSGRHLVVKGPPGTGKSQTIANLVATLVAQGQRVLFVAEKRAAIDAVTGRLDRVGLGDVVLDLHDGGGSRRRIAQALAGTLERVSRTPLPALAAQHRALEASRGTLAGHLEALHARRPPWGISAYEAQAAVAATPAEAQTDVRLPREALRALTPEALETVRARLREHADLGGLWLTPADSAWVEADVDTAEHALTVLDAARRARQRSLPEARDAITRATVEVGLPAPASVPALRETMALLVGVRNTLDVLRPDVWQSPLDDLAGAVAERRWRKAHGVDLGFFERRRLRKQARALRAREDGVDDARLHAALLDAREQLVGWRAAARDGRDPRVGPTLDAALAATADLTADLAALTAVLPRQALDSADLAALATAVDRLVAEEAVLVKVPRLRELRTALAAAGAGALVDRLHGRGVDARTAVAALDHAIASSVLAQLRFADPRLGTFDGSAHDRVVDDYRDRDVAHLASTAARVRRAHAEHLVGARDAHPDQAALVAAEAAKQRRHLPLRDLLRAAPDVLLSVRPCWAMSPLVVSQVLPAERLFDVVVMDEASQVPPADAVPALARGARVVVAGDEKQLPPTAFFATVAGEQEAVEPGVDAVEAALATGFESVLDVLSAALPQRSLRWHYRSRDERLVAFSNAAFYDGGLTTFPGVAGGDCLRLERVRQELGVDGQEDSVAIEVARVVELVLEHARTRPHESLGVITMGIVHAERIDLALRAALAEARDVEPWFGADADEPFFVKNLERVQGDERDAIVLSVGYGRTADGRLLHRFGPLNQAGGERRLNVAITRARRRMTVVCAFGPDDLEPARLRADGARLLRDYLAYAASGGSRAPVGAPDRQPDALERAIADRLVAEGLPVSVRYGVSGRVELAVAHPERPGRMVLAVETDGPGYRAVAGTRDRDRLRPEQLERLGWTHCRVWTPDWVADPDAVVARVREAWVGATAEADADDAADAAAADAARAPALAAAEPAAAPLVDVQPTLSAVRGPRPRVPAGRSIAAYTHRELVELVRWAESDTLLRTEEEVVREVMRELGFRRLGPRIEAALRAAVRSARQAASA